MTHDQTKVRLMNQGAQLVRWGTFVLAGVLTARDPLTALAHRPAIWLAARRRTEETAADFQARAEQECSVIPDLADEMQFHALMGRLRLEFVRGILRQAQQALDEVKEP